MKVVILCGGQGMRLREETEFRPKPLVEVGGRPILWHIMKHYAHYGHREFVLCLGYKGDMIKNYFLNYHLMGSTFTVELGRQPRLDLHQDAAGEDWRVTLVDTGLQALTGARLKRIQRFVEGERFMLTYGDGVSDVDLSRLLTCHINAGRPATVTGVHPPARFGELVSQGDRVVEFREKPQARQGRISGGFFVLEPQVFDYLEDDDSCNFERGPLATLASEGSLTLHEHDGFWQCMDTYRDLVLLNHLWDSGAPPWAVWSAPAASRAVPQPDFLTSAEVRP